MKHIISILLLSMASYLGAQTLTYTYELDTVHTGGSMRVDSFYLVENVSGFLVNDGALNNSSQQGDRSQTLSSPLYMTDTAQITSLAEQYLADSISLQAKIDRLRSEVQVLGAKARAILHLRDSVVYGAFLWVPENMYKGPVIMSEGIGFANEKPKGILCRRKRTGK